MFQSSRWIFNLKLILGLFVQEKQNKALVLLSEYRPFLHLLHNVTFICHDYQILATNCSNSDSQFRFWLVSTSRVDRHGSWISPDLWTKQDQWFFGFPKQHTQEDGVQSTLLFSSSLPLSLSTHASVSLLPLLRLFLSFFSFPLSYSRVPLRSPLINFNPMFNFLLLPLLHLAPFVAFVFSSVLPLPPSLSPFPTSLDEIIVPPHSLMAIFFQLSHLWTLWLYYNQSSKPLTDTAAAVWLRSVIVCSNHVWKNGWLIQIWKPVSFLKNCLP